MVETNPGVGIKLLSKMGHDAVMSPAHRRNQNPQSPSASFFRKTSTFSRDEIDLSWMALLRRHRFLLLMLSLLAFLCTIYLYFAIKLGAEDCAGLIGKELTQCQLKASKGKSFHGHRRLLSADNSVYGYPKRDQLRVAEGLQAVFLLDKLSDLRDVKTVVTLGCIGSDLTKYLEKRFVLSNFGASCKGGQEEMQFIENGWPDHLTKSSENMHLSFDMVICDKCNLQKFTDDKSISWNVNELLRPGGYFFQIPSTSFQSDVQLQGLSTLSSANGAVLWKK